MIWEGRWQKASCLSCHLLSGQICPLYLKKSTGMKRSNPFQSSQDIFQKKETLRNRSLHLWYRLTAMPEPPPQAGFRQREAARKSRFLSLIVLFLLCIFLGFVPACLALANPYVLVADLSMFPVCLLALLLNKLGHVMLGATFLTATFEGALTIVILTTHPFDTISIQQYELFVFGELLTVSLLDPEMVFLVAGYNIAIICDSLFFQLHTIDFQSALYSEWSPLLVRPVAVQILVAGVTYLWVRSAMRAMQRADRAELIAQLEHQIAQEKQAHIEELTRLEEGIARMEHAYVHLINHGTLDQLTPTMPMSSYPERLRPLINTATLLQRRLKSARHIEQEWQRVHDAILRCADQLEQGRVEALSHPTGTFLDV